MKRRLPVFSIINEKRLMILKELKDKEMTFREFRIQLRASKDSLRHNLQILEEKGFLTKTEMQVENTSFGVFHGVNKTRTVNLWKLTELGRECVEFFAGDSND